VLLEINCETDFVARNEQFQKLVKDIAMQIAGLHPLYVSQEQIPAAALEAKRAALLEDEALAKKPEAIRAQIVDGQLRKWFEEVCLLDQPFRDGDETVGQLITNAIATIGENIRVRRFVRYALGEEL
jgi:elongation factor Ts